MAKRFGVMLDASRNTVMKPEQVKEFALMMKRFGYNMLQLYTEETYEIPGEPYFGYLRGRYSQAELKDIVSYCESIGMEMIPCIQTLAHLPTIFRWGPYRAIHDIGVRAAYQAGEMGVLKELVQEYQELLNAVEGFVSAFQKLWYRENKPNGLEVHEHRLGGLLFRIRSQKNRLTEYTEGHLDAIPELEETLLPYWGASAEPTSDDTYMAHINSWKNSITVNRI